LDITWTPQVVSQVFTAHGIDVSMFGRKHTKSIKSIAEELMRGDSLIMQDASKYKALVRVVRVVQLHLIVDGVGHEEIILVNQGKSGNHPQLPTTRWRPYEHVQCSVDRLVESCGLSLPGLAFNVEIDKMDEHVKKSVSSAYPSLPIVRKFFIVPVAVSFTKTTSLHHIGLHLNGSTSDFKSKPYKYGGDRWEWWTRSQCKHKKIHLHRMLSPEKPSGKGCCSLLALIPPRRHFDCKLVEHWLRHGGVSPKHFADGRRPGQPNALVELADEMSQGRSVLLKSSGRLLRVCTLVLLRVETGCGQVLVETAQSFGDGAMTHDVKLPGCKKLPVEEVRDTARRIITQMLNLELAAFTIREDREQFLEEMRDSPSYPGLPTLYRKHVVYAVAASIITGQGDDTPPQRSSPRQAGHGREHLETDSDNQREDASGQEDSSRDDHSHSPHRRKDRKNVKHGDKAKKDPGKLAVPHPESTHNTPQELQGASSQDRWPPSASASAPAGKNRGKYLSHKDPIDREPSPAEKRHRKHVKGDRAGKKTRRRSS